MRVDGNRHSLIQVWFMLLSSTSLYHNLHKFLDRSEQRMQENPSSKRYEKICSIDWISIWTSSALEPMFRSCWSWQHCMSVDMWQPDVANPTFLRLCSQSISNGSVVYQLYKDKSGWMNICQTPWIHENSLRTVLSKKLASNIQSRTSVIFPQLWPLIAQLLLSFRTLFHLWNFHRTLMALIACPTPPYSNAQHRNSMQNYWQLP
jgi:hypothetical protein